MNIWIVRLGTKSFTRQEKNTVNQLLTAELQTDQYQSFEYKKSSLHYLSFFRNCELSNKTYNHIGTDGCLTAYSGILIGNQSASDDYRNAAALQRLATTPRQFFEKITGNFGIIHANENTFQCFIDFTGIHKVFYYLAPDQSIYVSNFIDLIKIFKNSEFNNNVIIDWLTTQKIFFQETEEIDIYTLPEYGILKWTKDRGVKTDQVSKPSEIVYSQKSSKKLLKFAVQTLRNNARYLKNYHNTTIALSGGFDSRMVLSMFWGLDHKNLDAYTFKENYYDMPIAIRVARDHNIKHHILELTGIPTIEELHRHIEKQNYPYLKYSNAFDYLVSKQMVKTYHGRHSVVLKGSAGNHDRTFEKFNFVNKYEGERAIRELANYLLFGSSLLRPDALTMQKKRIEEFYMQKYMGEIAHRGTSHKLDCLQYIDRYKRSNSCRTKQVHNNAMDQYLPMLNNAVMELVFHTPYSELNSKKRGSIIHQLITAFTGGEDKPIHFTSGLHWQANKLSRVIRRIQTTYIDPCIKKISGQEIKFAKNMKKQFYKKNKSLLQEIVAGSENSNLWDYFDRTLTLQILNKNNHQVNNDDIEFIYKMMAPAIKMEYRRDKRKFPPSINFFKSPYFTF